MNNHGEAGLQDRNLANVINANFYSGFLIPLSTRYPTDEWNAAMRQVISVRAAGTHSDTL